MTGRVVSKDGSVHVTDEFYNTLIAAAGAFLSLVGVVLLISQSWAAGKPWHVLSFSLYGFGLLSLFVSSALHHGVDGSTKVNHFLHQLDYFAIFVMIAGTFTPICLILLKNLLGWGILALIWSLAIAGILLKGVFPKIRKGYTTALYIVMGWLGLLIVYPVYQIIAWKGFSFLLLGGLSYTFGALIFHYEKPNPFPGKFGFHEIWHLFVLTAAASHFCVMYFFVLPR